MDNVQKYYVNVLKNHYADFSGRATRREFWMFALFNFLVSIIISVLDSMLFGGESTPLSLLYSIGVLLPSIGIGIRRLHDIGKSGWWLLIGLIPFVGWIILIWFYATPTKK